MFKKKTPPPPAGRYRQVTRTPEQRNAAVFSYHASRSARPASTNRNEQTVVTAASTKRRNTQRKWFKRAPAIATFVLLLIVVGLNLPVSDNAKVITAQNAQGGIFLRPATTYNEAVRKQLSGSIKNSNKLTINTDDIANDLRAQFPELASVTVTLPFVGTRPTIYLEPATPMLILTTVSSEVYVLDQTGRALITAGQVANLSKLNLPVVRDDTGSAVKLGQIVLPGSSVSFITEVIGQLRTKHVEFETLILPVSASELDVKVKGVPYSVKFNLMGNARAEAGAYLAVKQQLESQHKTPGTYVDVRVNDRAYYR